MFWNMKEFPPYFQELRRWFPSSMEVLRWVSAPDLPCSRTDHRLNCLRSGLPGMAKNLDTVDGRNPINTGINHISTGAGFRNDPQYFLILFEYPKVYLDRSYLRYFCIRRFVFLEMFGWKVYSFRVKDGGSFTMSNVWVPMCSHDSCWCNGMGAASWHATASAKVGGDILVILAVEDVKSWAHGLLNWNYCLVERIILPTTQMEPAKRGLEDDVPTRKWET